MAVIPFPVTQSIKGQSPAVVDVTLSVVNNTGADTAEFNLERGTVHVLFAKTATVTATLLRSKDSKHGRGTDEALSVPTWNIQLIGLNRPDGYANANGKGEINSVDVDNRLNVASLRIR